MFGCVGEPFSQRANAHESQLATLSWPALKGQQRLPAVGLLIARPVKTVLSYHVCAAGPVEGRMHDLLEAHGTHS